MMICDVCHERNLEGELFCGECGNQLMPLAPKPRPAADSVSTLQTSAVARGLREAPAPAPDDALRLKPGQMALLIGSVPQAVILEGRSEYVLGREGQEHVIPDVNLNAYGAREKGVSRVHAALRRDRHQVLLIDLGSTNGTRLNNQTLTAHQAVKVESGDEIRLGKLAVKISFVL
jgi:pSer/pThr/pTyr-binding forkhead associated (FHA) protein